MKKITAAICMAIIISGCATSNYQAYLDQQVAVGKQAAYEKYEKSLAALVCARKYTDENWHAGTPTEVADASLSVCSSELDAFSRATLRLHEAQAAIEATDSNSLSHGRNTAALLTRDEVEQERTKLRASVIRRALELRANKTKSPGG